MGEEVRDTGFGEKFLRKESVSEGPSKEVCKLDTDAM